MRIICFSLVWLLCGPALALDTLRLKAGFGKADVIKHALIARAGKEFRIQEIVEKLKSGNDFQLLERANQGYSDNIFWVAIPLQTGNAKNLFIEIQNPQLDHLDAFQLNGAKIIPLGETTGDEHFFSTRNVPHRNFIWRIPVTDASTTTILFRIEKLNSSMVIPIFIWEADTFRQYDTKLLIFYGICFGIMLIVMLYSLAMGVILKQRIQFQYVVMVSVGILYFLVAEGLASQFLYPNQVGVNGFMRLLIIAANAITFIIFSNSFLNIKNYYPNVFKGLMGLVALLVVMALLVPLIGNFYLDHSAFFIPFTLTITFAGTFAPVVIAGFTFKKQRETSIFYLIAYSTILFTSTLVRLEDVGWIERFDFNPVYIGTFTENLIFFVALGYRTKKVYDQRNELSLRISKHQKEMMQSYVRGTEQERQRIARDLHDDIGSRMSHLKRQIESQKQISLLHEVENLCNDIRNLSHQLAPQAIRFNSLTQLIQQQGYQLHQAGIEVNLQQYDFPKELDDDTKAELLRIVQEALNNILKHSGAKQVDIQLFKHDNELVITIEDDGQGFDEQQLSGGIGLDNMRARAESLDGKLEISSKLDEGTSLLITIPYSTDSTAPG
jgi:two-component system, sensor histidine kinase LadS